MFLSYLSPWREDVSSWTITDTLPQHRTIGGLEGMPVQQLLPAETLQHLSKTIRLRDRHSTPMIIVIGSLLQLVQQAHVKQTYSIL